MSYPDANRARNEGDDETCPDLKVGSSASRRLVGNLDRPA